MKNTHTTNLFTIDEEFCKLLPPLNSCQKEKLQESMLREGAALSPLIVWKENNILIDGHQRWAILQEHPELRYEIEYISLAGRDEAIEWIFRNNDSCHQWRSLFEKVERYIEVFGDKFKERRQAKMKN